MTHLHTVYTAMSVYANDSDGDLPPFAFTPAAGVEANPRLFVDSLKAQGASTGIWFCPADAHAHSKFRGLWADFSVSSYAMPPTTVAKGKSEEGFLLPMPTDTSTLLLCDSPFLASKRVTSAHGSKSNALFGDGHTKPTQVTLTLN